MEILVLHNFHLIGNIIFLLIDFQKFQNLKVIRSLWAIQKQVAVQIQHNAYYREPVHMAMANVAQPWFRKPTGVRQHTGARPTDRLSHRGSDLLYI